MLVPVRLFNMPEGLEFTLNGKRVGGFCSPNTPLLEFLRGLGLTGAKEGCAEGDCGACSVVMLDNDSRGNGIYRSINSCLVPACLMAGRELITPEGVGQPGKLHPVQQKMVECHGSQCGYCTPGFIASLVEGYYRDDLKKSDQLDDQLCGNLCRCTGYRPIREAAIEAFQQRHRRNGADPLGDCLKKSAPTLEAFEYAVEGERFFRPDSLPDLFRLMEQQPTAKLIAGATELGLEITKKFRRFPGLISVEAVPELREIRSTETEWSIGAAATLTEIEETLAEEFPVFSKMLRVFGSRQIRNRATMGGNIVTASPIGDSAPVLLALDARVTLASAKAERTIPIDEFFVAYRKTALQLGEILKSIVIPRPPRRVEMERHCDWFKVSRRREMDISTVAACFTINVDGDGIVNDARLAYGGVAAMPLRARKAEIALIGNSWSEDSFREVSSILDGEFSPISDVRGSAEYRARIITNLFEKFFWQTKNPTLPIDNVSSLLSVSKTRGNARPSPHESGHKHVTGEAVYTDDETAGKPVLEVWPVCSLHARARILKRDVAAARSMPGIKAVLVAEDVPGLNDSGTKNDEALLADKDILYHSQIVALVVGDSAQACRAAAEKVAVEYEPFPPILTLEQALAAKSFHNEPNYFRRGNISEALRTAPQRLHGVFELGGQEHFYLESHAAWASPGEDGSITVVSSTQHPSEVQAVVAHVLHQPNNKIVVEAPRMGGGFGGKETQAAVPAALAALAAQYTGRPVRVRFNRDQDMMITGHRHPFLARFEVGYDRKGNLLAVRVQLYSNGGWSLDLSQAVTDRALSHLDNAYYIPAVEFRGQVAKTNLSSNTAFRGFGGPQGMLVIEEIIDRIARRLGLPPEIVRERNLYRGKGETNTTHYGQEIGDNRIQTIWHELKKTSRLKERRKEIARWNAANPHVKRGLAMTPVKFGISFTVTHLNQAGALVLIYQDGTVQVNHGGTEMGQGVHTNVRMVAAKELGIPLDSLRVMTTRTDKVPNTSATAASCGTDLNGAAVQDACEKLRARLEPIAVKLLRKKSGQKSSSRNLLFKNGKVCDPKRPRTTVTFREVAKAAYIERVSLSTTGFYRTPGIHWDRVNGRGRPFHYFACGAAVTEVEVDGFTGMHQVLRTDILHDVGSSINEGVNRGQVEGGFVQGMGWLTTEELVWDEQGRLLTHSPDTYKIPAIGDVPRIFNVRLLKNAGQKGVVHGSKAVGEPPLMLAISVREAIRDAVSAFGPSDREILLKSPATCEGILSAIQAAQQNEPGTRQGRARIAEKA
jgi:xanthine dehydrogenase molybdopterin binding subunit/xanthine dehydrogenase small subunit